MSHATITANPLSQAENRSSSLEHLHRLQTVTPGNLEVEDRNRIQFYFRASDPALYQAACIAAGRHLLADPELYRFCEAYAHTREQSLTEPISFRGERARRRLLLLLASAMRSQDEGTQPHPELADVVLPAVPFDEASFRGDLPPNAADASLVLAAVQLLAASPASIRRVKESLPLMVKAVPGHSYWRREPSLPERFGQLLGHLPEAEATKLYQPVLLNELQHLNGGEAKDCGALLRAWTSLESVIAAGLKLQLLSLEDLQHELSPFDLEFLRLRVRCWQLRKGDGPCASPEPEGPIEPDCPLLRAAFDWWRSTPADGAGLAGSRERTAALQLLRLILPIVSNRNRWLELDVREKALSLFLLAELAENLTLNSHQWNAYAEGSGLPLGSGGFYQANSKGFALLHAVLVRLLEWEPSGPEVILSQQQIHTIENPLLLLALLPSDRPSLHNHILVDAVENRIRSELRRSPHYDPEVLLAQASIRRPHRSFFAELSQLCRDRSYLRGNDETYTLRETIDWWTGAVDANPGEADSSVLKQALEAVQQPLPEDPGACLIEWADRIHTKEDKASLTRILELLHAASPEHPLRAGNPAFAETALGTIQQQTEASCLRLRAAADALGPSSWKLETGVQLPQQEALQELRTLESILLHFLPQPFAESWQARMTEVEERLLSWQQHIEPLATAWKTFTVAADAKWPEKAANALWSHFGHTALPEALQTAIHHELWLAMDSCVPAGSPAEEGFLSWSLDQQEVPADSGHALQNALAESYALRLRAMMDRREIDKVRQHIRNPRANRLLKSSAFVELLREIHDWSQDVFQPGLARKAAALQAAVTGARAPSALRNGMTFLIQFSPVWIGLLIGAILMLDFGDAWVSMAEEEDLAGIGITFAIGLIGTYLYLMSHLRQRTRPSPDQSRIRFWLRQAGRCGLFLGLCLVYTLCVTAFMWFLLSNTEEVVHGPWAIGHIFVWSGFALFIGVFFSLIAKSA
ncbi:MAG: hypothetical protein JJU20_02960 [Opitutales bacterium]|nr:hypothetical protein [Opitutales bacterium]